MKFSAEIATNPGCAAWFVTEFTLEHGEAAKKGYWGLHLSWWLLKSFRAWLWDYENDPGNNWRLFRLRLAGFEIVWERKK